MLSPAQFREEAPSFMDSQSCYSPQFTKPGSLTQLTVPSVSGATLYIFAQNPPMALKSQPRPHPIEPLALGANGVHVILLSELEALHCLPVSQLQTSRYTPAFPLILGKALFARDASSTTTQSRCFLVYRLLLCESTRDCLTPIRYTNKQDYS